MPIIRTSRIEESTDGLVAAKLNKDKFEFTHIENVEPLARTCYEMRKDPQGVWSKDRQFRLIAKIPQMAFFANKHLTNPDGSINQKEMKKYLNSPDGELFKTVDKGI